MRFNKFMLSLFLTCVLPICLAQSAPEVKTVDWDLLMPTDWDPMAAFEGINAEALNDDDPNAQKALEQVMAAWQDAPMNPDVEHMAIRLPGFIVSLSGEGQAMSEFLLVPTFGACIHVPPPPPNQVIHVISEKPISNYQTMDLVWVSGVIAIEHTQTDMAYAGYRMDMLSIEPYKGEVY